MKKNLIVLKIASKISDFISAQDTGNYFSSNATSNATSNETNHLQDTIQAIPGATPVQSPKLYMLPSPEDNPKQYSNELNKYFRHAKDEDSTIALPLELLFFHTKPENRQMLEKLLKSKVDFYFINENHEKIDRQETDVILKYFNLGQKKETSRKRVSPDTVWGNPELNSQANTEWASRKKTQKALFDVDNIYARQQIIKLKQHGHSANKIAALLNEQEFQTSRGKYFQAKQITRHLETYKEILELFKPKLTEQEFLTADQKSDSKMDFPLERIELPQDKDFILIYLSKPFKEDFSVSITDNQERLTFYKQYSASAEKKGVLDLVIIDILKDTTIYPGSNYICISSNGYEDLRDKIIVRPDLIVNE